MSAGTVLYLILIAGGILAMVAMHRGGAGGMGCGGHGQHTQGHETDRANAPHATFPHREADLDPPDGSDGQSAPAGSARP